MAAAGIGAEAVQMGTRFVSSAESPVHYNYKNAIVEAPTTGTYVLNKKAPPCIWARFAPSGRINYEEGLMPPETFANILDLYFVKSSKPGRLRTLQMVGLIDEVRLRGRYYRRYGRRPDHCRKYGWAGERVLIDQFPIRHNHPVFIGVIQLLWWMATPEKLRLTS